MTPFFFTGVQHFFFVKKKCLFYKCTIKTKLCAVQIKFGNYNKKWRFVYTVGQSLINWLLCRAGLFWQLDRFWWPSVPLSTGTKNWPL